MDNNVTGNPWILNTTGSTTALAWKGNVYVENIELEKYTADVDTAVICDAAGREITTLNGASDLSTVRTGKIGWVHDGLYLSSLSNANSNVKVFIK